MQHPATTLHYVEELSRLELVNAKAMISSSPISSATKEQLAGALFLNETDGKIRVIVALVRSSRGVSYTVSAL